MIGNILQEIKENQDKMNMYTKERYYAFANGRTLTFYMKHPENKEFISSVQRIINMLIS